jgi:hypothetical protein
LVNLNGSAFRNAFFAPRLLRAFQGQLLGQQFVEFHAGPGRVGVFDQGVLVDVGRRVVQQAHRRLEFGQLQALAHRPRHRVLPVDALHGVGNRAPQDGLRQALAGRIDRGEGSRQRRAFVDDLVIRVDHLGAEEAVAHLAAGAHARALGQLLDLAAVEVHEAQLDVGGLICDGHQQLLARLVSDFILDHDAFDLRHVAAAQAGLADRHDLGFVLVAHRQVQHQVHVGVQAELGELALDAFGCRCGGRFGFGGGHKG